MVEQFWKNETRIILFVVMGEGLQLNHTIEDAIKNKLKIACSPRHVPAKIISVPEIPRTKSGKVMEIAVKYVINNMEVKNKESMVNPDSLLYFQNLTQLTQEDTG